MANRTMQAKAMKLQRQLRKLPRSTSEDVPGIFEDWKGSSIPKRLLGEAVSVPRQPNRELMEGYQHRAKSLGMDNSRARFTGITPARKEAIEQSFNAALRSVRETVGDDMPSFTILSNHIHRARVFFNPQKTQWMILYENFREAVVKRSMIYQDKKRLIDDFKSSSRRLVWVETKSFPCHSEGGS